MKYRNLARRRNRLGSRLVLATLVAGIVGGCTLGPEPKRPQTVLDDDTAFKHAPTPDIGTLDGELDKTAEHLGQWWRRLGDPVVESWVEQALSANTDLKIAAARVLEARAQVDQSRATRLPELSAGTSATRSKSSFSLPQVGRVAVYSTTYSADLSVAYQLDLFGKLRRTRQGAWASLLAQEEARETVLHTVVAEVVRSRVRTSTLEHSVELATAVRDSRGRTLESVERRYNAGLTNAVDLRLARENLAGAEADLIGARQALDSAYLAVDVLLGRRPGSGERPTEPSAQLPPVEPVPLGLPAELLDRRPDLRQAEMQLAAATAGIGASLADLFPTLSLSGSVGGRSDGLSNLLSSESLVYNAVANLLGPIFDGGRRRAAVDAAEARAEQAAAAYSGAVLRALRDVEDALIREQASRTSLDFLEERVREARAAENMARERYGRGVAPLLQVLETERRLKAAENALSSGRAALWNARIDLHLALGGDWHDTDAAEPSAEPAPGTSDPSSPQNSPSDTDSVTQENPA